MIPFWFVLVQSLIGSLLLGMMSIFMLAIVVGRPQLKEYKRRIPSIVYWLWMAIATALPVIIYYDLFVLLIYSLMFSAIINALCVAVIAIFFGRKRFFRTYSEIIPAMSFLLWIFATPLIMLVYIQLWC